jgi:Ca2+-binding RTX toxin-like protein
MLINGTESDDVLTGTTAFDEINGLGGNDAIDGGLGDDRLSGGLGSDRFVYGLRGFGNDTILDFSSGDRIDLSAFNIGTLTTLRNFISQDGPNAVIQLNSAERITLTDTRADQLTSDDFVFNTSTQALTVTGTASVDLLFGGNGNDQLYGGSGDRLYAGLGADRLYATGRFVDMHGEGGVDTFVVANPDLGVLRIFDWQADEKVDLSIIDMGSLDLLRRLSRQDGDHVTIDAGPNAAQIWIYNTTLAQLGESNFVFHLRTDNQIVNGAPGAGVLWGGSGDDLLMGGTARLYGEDGNDRLVGDANDAQWWGGAGSDVFMYSHHDGDRTGGDIQVMDFAQNDRLDLSGTDVSTWGQLRDHVHQSGADTVFEFHYGSLAPATLTLANFDLSALRAEQVVFRTEATPLNIVGTYANDDLFGGRGDDNLDGLSGQDYIYGGAGNDLIDGGEDSDTLYGEAGNDMLAGRGGNDVIDGGTGIDTAIYVATRGEYQITFIQDGSIVVEGTEGVDRLWNVERLQFSDRAEVISSGRPVTVADPSAVLLGFGANEAAGGWADNTVYPRTVADVNGDGLADLVGFGSAGVNVSFGQPSGGFGAVFLALDAFGQSEAAGGWSTSERFPRSVADINGDGRADIVGFGADGAYASLGSDDGRFGQIYLASTNFGAADSAGGWWSNDRYLRDMGDVNGDGWEDIVGFGAAGTYVALAQADGTFGSSFLATPSFGALDSAGGWSSNDRYLRLLADVNADGQDDIVGFGAAGTFVALAQADGHFGNFQLAIAAFGTSDAAGGWSSNDRFPRAVADMNGDGLNDLVGFGAAGEWLSLNRGDGTFADPELVLNAFGRNPEAGGWVDANLYPRVLADVNGDGLADTVGFGSNFVYVAHTSELG